MAIVRKTIGTRTYCYLAEREGGKVRHRYLGPAEDPGVLGIVAAAAEAATVPDRFRPLFWDTSLDRIHLKKNARYIIERVLEHGDLAAFTWVQFVYPGRLILQTLRTSRRISDRSRAFWLAWFGERDA
jgi:hypothetical protein